MEALQNPVRANDLDSRNGKVEKKVILYGLATDMDDADMKARRKARRAEEKAAAKKVSMDEAKRGASFQQGSYNWKAIFFLAIFALPLLMTGFIYLSDMVRFSRLRLFLRFEGFYPTNTYCHPPPLRSIQTARWRTRYALHW